MIKNIVKRLVALGVCTALTTGGALAADAVSKQITVQYNTIKLVVDNVPITPKDANGVVIEPFIYQGTTYLPVRAVGEALGKTVTWDGASKTVYIGEASGDINEPTSETPEPVVVSEPEPMPTPEPTPQPETTSNGRSPSATVYVSNASDTIHSIPNCGKMKNYRTMTLEKAEANGYKYCKKCW